MKSGRLFSRKQIFAIALIAALLSSVESVVHAASLPGAADAGRIDAREGLHLLEVKPLFPTQTMQSAPVSKAPEQSKTVTLTLHDVHITGMSVFKVADVEGIYAPYLNREVTLDTVWKIAEELTERYHNAGYFLSRVVVPQQEIEDGNIVLHVVEGYVGEVKLDSPLAQNRIVKKWIDKLLSYRPLKADQIESVLLHLNDLPGVSLHAVVEPMEAEGMEGATRLVLEPRDTPLASGSISLDNYGSRFLGPYESQVQTQFSLLPTQRTTLAVLSSLQMQKLKYGSLKHELPLFAGGTLELYGSYTTAAPGYTLTPYDIKSRSTTAGTAVDYSIIRQRQENLTGRIALELHNTNSDIRGAQLTKDDIRAARANMNYQNADNWGGQNTLDATLSQGLIVFGSSEVGQMNLSNPDAKPNFTKFDATVSRLQGLVSSWSLFATAAGQLASGPLYSSEQFGYGGQAFGRAYDDSEITGDQGLNGSAELRYAGIDPWLGFQLVPYQFYDIGAVWNKGQDTTLPFDSGSSAGVGVRLLSDYGFSGNFGLGFPLTRRVSNPLYGNGKNPRYYMQVSYGF